MINVSRICCSCTTLNKILLLEQIYTYLLLPLLLWSIKHMCRYLLIFVWTPKGLQSSLWLYYANENIALLINIVAWLVSFFIKTHTPASCLCELKIMLLGNMIDSKIYMLEWESPGVSLWTTTRTKRQTFQCLSPSHYLKGSRSFSQPNILCVKVRAICSGRPVGVYGVAIMEW